MHLDGLGLLEGLKISGGKCVTSQGLVLCNNP